jgi:hypothetical protein
MGDRTDDPGGRHNDQRHATENRRQKPAPFGLLGNRLGADSRQCLLQRVAVLKTLFRISGTSLQ